MRIFEFTQKSWRGAHKPRYLIQCFGLHLGAKELDAQLCPYLTWLSGAGASHALLPSFPRVGVMVMTTQGEPFPDARGDHFLRSCQESRLEGFGIWSC